MSKSPKEKLSDLLIGEAVMSLLDADEEVTFVALLRALTEARDKPENSNRVAAYNTAIADIKDFTAAQHSENGGASRFAATTMGSGWALSDASLNIRDTKH